MRVNVNECMNELGKLQRDTLFEQFGWSKGPIGAKQGTGEWGGNSVTGVD